MGKLLGTYINFWSEQRTNLLKWDMDLWPPDYYSSALQTLQPLMVGLQNVQNLCSWNTSQKSEAVWEVVVKTPIQ